MAGNDIAVELIVRSFRRLGLNVDHANRDGMTALLIAVDRGHIECATVLASDGRANINTVHPISRLTAEQLAVTSTGYSLRRPPVVWPSKSHDGPNGDQSAEEEDFETCGRTRRVVSLTGLPMSGMRGCAQWDKPDSRQFMSGRFGAIEDVITESDDDDDGELILAMDGKVFASCVRRRVDEPPACGREVVTTTDSEAVRICCDDGDVGRKTEHEASENEETEEDGRVGKDGKISAVELSSTLGIDARRHVRRTSLPARRIYIETTEESKTHEPGDRRHRQEDKPSTTQVSGDNVVETIIKRLAIVESLSESKQCTQAGNGYSSKESHHIGQRDSSNEATAAADRQTSAEDANGCSKLTSEATRDSDDVECEKEDNTNGVAG